VNASAAVTGSKNGTDWSAWETYANGAYTRFLSNSTPPSSTGVPASSGTAATTAAVTVVPGTCVIPYPTLNLVVTTVGGGCVLTKSEARAVIGGLVLVAGALTALPGLIILVASGFRVSGAGAVVSTLTPSGLLTAKSASSAKPVAKSASSSAGAAASEAAAVPVAAVA
jgi:hypothetical protein